jgi:hypothetical protein
VVGTSLAAQFNPSSNINEEILVLTMKNIIMPMIAEPAKIFKVGSNDVWRITSSPVRGWSTSLKFKAILLLVLGMVV